MGIALVRQGRGCLMCRTSLPFALHAALMVPLELRRLSSSRRTTLRTSTITMMSSRTMRSKGGTVRCGRRKEASIATALCTTQRLRFALAGAQRCVVAARAREKDRTQRKHSRSLAPLLIFSPPFLLLSTLRVTTARLAQWRRSRANRVHTQRKVPRRALIALRHDTALLAQWWPTHRFPLREHRCTQSALTQSTAARCEGR